MDNFADCKEKLIRIIGSTECHGPDGREEPGACGYRKDGRCSCVEKLDHCVLVQIAKHLISNGATINETVQPMTLDHAAYKEAIGAAREKLNRTVLLAECFQQPDLAKSYSERAEWMRKVIFLAEMGLSALRKEQ